MYSVQQSGTLHAVLPMKTRTIEPKNTTVTLAEIQCPACQQLLRCGSAGMR